MAPSRYRLQIVDDEGVLASVVPGGHAELALVDRLVAAIMAKGVGLLRTSGHVEADVRAGIEETIYELKSHILPPQ